MLAVLLCTCHSLQNFERSGLPHKQQVYCKTVYGCYKNILTILPNDLRRTHDASQGDEKDVPFQSSLPEPGENGDKESRLSVKGVSSTPVRVPHQNQVSVLLMVFSSDCNSKRHSLWFPSARGHSLYWNGVQTTVHQTECGHHLGHVRGCPKHILALKKVPLPPRDAALGAVMHTRIVSEVTFVAICRSVPSACPTDCEPLTGKENASSNVLVLVLSQGLVRDRYSNQFWKRERRPPSVHTDTKSDSGVETSIINSLLHSCFTTFVLFLRTANMIFKSKL